MSTKAFRHKLTQSSLSFKSRHIIDEHGLIDGLIGGREKIAYQVKPHEDLAFLDSLSHVHGSFQDFSPELGIPGHFAPELPRFR